MRVESKAIRNSFRTSVFVCFILANLSLIRVTGNSWPGRTKVCVGSRNQRPSPFAASRSQTPSNAGRGTCWDRSASCGDPASGPAGPPPRGSARLPGPAALPEYRMHAINRAVSEPDAQVAANSLQRILDPYVLAIVDINAESRVKVERGPADPVLTQGGSRFSW